MPACAARSKRALPSSWTTCTATPLPIRTRPRAFLRSGKSASPSTERAAEAASARRTMWTLCDKYCIAGIGETAYTKASGRTVLDLASEACLKAANDAGVALEDIDGIVSFHFNDSV